MNPDQRRQALDEIAAEVASCTKCPLYKTRTRAVPGEGHPETEVVFVGEGPGYNEDQEGRPFVGAAGGLLNELLKAIGWKREEVFITNVVKCRPPGNRDPEPFEIETCAPYLKRQLEVLDPAVIVTLGRYSLGTFMPGARISAAHGTSRPTDPATGASNAETYAMYHPAAALRQYSLRETMLDDMCNLPEVLTTSRGRRDGTNPSSVVVGAVPVAAVPATDALAAPEPVAAPTAVAEPAAVPISVEPDPETEAMLENETMLEPAVAGGSDEPQLGLFG